MRKHTFTKTLGALFVAFSMLPIQAFAMPPDAIITDADLFDANSMSREQVQRFLIERGALGSRQFVDVDGVLKNAADIISRVAFNYQINPKFLLTMLQKEQSLVEDPSPNQNQLDWAMGYAICDSCSKSDPRLQGYRGFANQLEAAALRIRGSYLAEMEQFGRTASGYGPGLPLTIDGQLIVPINKATAVLYNYTPHLFGNKNFYDIWHNWFNVRYPDGTLLQAKGQPGVWLIHFGKRRAFQSRAALTSRFDISNVLQVPSSEIENYEIGYPIKFNNYSILQSPEGQIYLLVDDTLRPIDAESFRAIGFSPDEIIPVEQSDLAFYELGKSITEAAQNLSGELWRETESGLTYFVNDSERHPIASPEILSDRYADLRVQTVSATELQALTPGDPIKFRNGSLIKARGEPKVYLISNGVRKFIPNERIFNAYGWKFENVIETSREALAIHPEGNELTLPIFDADPDLTIANFGSK
ncbi:MAG: hypothetical protein V1821_04450 [bacterium]